MQTIFWEGTCVKAKVTSVWGANVGSSCRYLYCHHKETKETNSRVLRGGGALLFGRIVSFIVCNLCLSAYRRIPKVS